ncbi:Transcriptional regulator, TetR family [Pseudonocardia sp. Ae168_Ps1]|uniref:TetR/AcrR family transcriptional regulator n=1 Tax=unclassified Pseudonocardia TaxID=2619320 RepID=UPI00094B4411|nr:MULTISPECIES: TetR/AcrR family transcriptional regulator [unclassified Pseudonocardia]OLL73254.1 Transcriptional regulator, TetR family [Pseudonocardia sp. Ae150A_Ps1]OLL79232.1 Transcriptional regulator, TetR family [Pseudonocardia sp. Ae168_Ps1]OLL86631.1 Transcriptional regulator, TetR family [Pseudonocardia sp. Ae263_Ps1]OLL93322.1 Transcriptional regulator, TetR family [Pseudonocardia sp. Ae356_Ps1]
MPPTPTTPEDAPARERILDAAEDLFAAHGFDATPTSRVAERAGVPKGLVHYYFRRKPDLLEALVDRLPHPVRGRDVLVPGDLAAGLRALVTELDRVLESSALLSHLLWREADTHPAVREALQRRTTELEDAVHEVLVPAAADPERVRGAARLLAAAIGHRHATARHTGDQDGMEAELAFVAGALG